MTTSTLEQRLAWEGLDAHPWSNGPGVVYPVHSHDYDKVIVVVAGSIEFRLAATGSRADLGPGDRLELPAGTAQGATVGTSGVTCLEAHRPTGWLPPEPRSRRAADW